MLPGHLGYRVVAHIWASSCPLQNHENSKILNNSCFQLRVVSCHKNHFLPCFSSRFFTFVAGACGAPPLFLWSFPTPGAPAALPNLPAGAPAAPQTAWFWAPAAPKFCLRHPKVPDFGRLRRQKLPEFGRLRRPKIAWIRPQTRKEKKTIPIVVFRPMAARIGLPDLALGHQQLIPMLPLPERRGRGT